MTAIGNSSFRHFPPETLDAVVDQLHDDTNPLAACGLACKLLLPSSRYHLFSDITFTGAPNQMAQFLELLKQPSVHDLADLVLSIQ